MKRVVVWERPAGAGPGVEEEGHGQPLPSTQGVENKCSTLSLPLSSNPSLLPPIGLTPQEAGGPGSFFVT